MLRSTEDAAGRAIEREMVAIRRELVSLIQAQPLDAVTPARRARRLESIAAKADEVLTAGYQRLATLSRERLLGLAIEESKAAGATLQQIARASAPGIDLTAIQLPTRAMLRSIVTTQPVQGWVMRDYWKGQTREIRDKFTATIRDGMLQQESVSELVTRVRGSRLPNGSYRGGIMSVANRNAQAMVRTAINEIATTAAFESYRVNSEVTEEYEYLTVDDDRRTEICEALDGNRYRYDDPGAVKPPQHWGCRSTIIPVIDLGKLRALAQG
jgi:SPP1 gp7 family putative phage head morphogenesis protein